MVWRSSAGIFAGSGMARTFLVCEERNLRSDSRIFVYLLPRDAAARRAALIAPALPIARVPTGIPPGICAIESSESSPLRGFDSIGTPKTGRTVLDDVFTYRCGSTTSRALMALMLRFCDFL